MPVNSRVRVFKWPYTKIDLAILTSAGLKTPKSDRVIEPGQNRHMAPK